MTMLFHLPRPSSTLIALGLILTSCDADPDPKQTPTTKPLTSIVEATCLLDIPGAICHQVVVPEHHGVDSDRTITLSIMTLPATSGDSDAEPLVMFNGGPGSEAFGLGYLFLPGEMAAQLNVDHDIVLMSERGTFGSTPHLDCWELAAVDEVFDAPAAQKNASMRSSLEACYDRLGAEGIDLSAFNNDERAADVPVVLEALGYEGWHIWGVSAGALLVQRLVRDQPGGILTAMADSGGFPTPNFTSIFSDVMVNASQRFDRMFSECAADAVCGTQFPDLEQQLFALTASLNAAPRAVTVTHPTTLETREIQFDGDQLLLMITNNMASVESLPLVITLASLGDFSIIESLLPSTLVSYTGDAFTDGMYRSVVCADLAGLDGDDVLVDGALPEIVAAMSGVVGDALDLGDIWDVPHLPMGELAGSDTIPILIMEGMYDTNRTPEFGRVAAENYATVHVAEFGDKAHVVLDGCAVSLMGQFMADPSVPPDMGCVADRVEWVPLY